MDSKPHPNGETKRRNFMDLFTMATTEGKLKSTFLLYAFSLSFVCVLVYAVASLVMVKPIDSALAGRAPVAVLNLIEAVVPALAGTLLLLLLGVWLKDKRLLPTAFGLLLLFALAVLVMVFFSFEGTERADALLLYLLFIPAPVLTGCAAVLLQFIYHRRKKTE